MSRKRITQIFPFLIPFRTWQRKQFFYLKMRFDKNSYARAITDSLLPYTLYETSSVLINENSGFDRQYQLNKVHNLKLAARTLNRIIIAPDEVFSFWQLVRQADRKEKYKDGLNFVNGKIVGSYGGGLCQLSNMLFTLFLHSPLTITERHGHTTLSFPPAQPDALCGVDATVHEGWLDLKARNETDNTFQIIISFDEQYMYGRILSKAPADTDYSVYNGSVSYTRKDGRLYQNADVCRSETDRITGEEKRCTLYVNQCEIAYELPNSVLTENIK